MTDSLRAALALILLACAGLMPTSVAADCPVNYLIVANGFDGVGVGSSAPAFGYSEGTAWTYGQPCQDACYDLRQGDVVARGSGGGISSGGGYYDLTTSSLQVTDTYTITGLSPGTRCHFTVELEITSTTPDSCGLSAAISEPSSGAKAGFQIVSREPSATRVVNLPLDESAGSPFTLEFDLLIVGLTGGSPSPSRAEGRISFGGLTKGASITSCQTYDIPVPTRGVSWGSIKAHYR